LCRHRTTRESRITECGAIVLPLFGKHRVDFYVSLNAFFG